LLALGIDPARVVLSRRGLNHLPEMHPLRPDRRPLRILCVARLVPKKGLSRQLRIYAACRVAGLRFQVRILGAGPLAARLRAETRSAGLESLVELVGAVPEADVWRELAAADVLVHTGVVDPRGDRDGLPNVVPEAMAAGAVVVTAPAPGVLEAVRDGVTGLVCRLDDPASWVRALFRVQDDDELAAHLRAGARKWVETEFDASSNAARLLSRFPSASPRDEAPTSVPGTVRCLR
jgi:glycosyltransferase involved in cell wall biosynthesis